MDVVFAVCIMMMYAAPRTQATQHTDCYLIELLTSACRSISVLTSILWWIHNIQRSPPSPCWKCHPMQCFLHSMNIHFFKKVFNQLPPPENVLWVASRNFQQGEWRIVSVSKLRCATDQRTLASRDRGGLWPRWKFEYQWMFSGQSNEGQLSVSHEFSSQPVTG